MCCVCGMCVQQTAYEKQYDLYYIYEYTCNIHATYATFKEHQKPNGLSIFRRVKCTICWTYLNVYKLYKRCISY